METSEMVVTSGTPGTGGTSGTGRTPGTAGIPGTERTLGTERTPGMAGTPGTTGTPGTETTPGTRRTPGTAGTSGTCRTPGTKRTPGTAGTPGTERTLGTERTPGMAGTPGWQLEEEETVRGSENLDHDMEVGAEMSEIQNAPDKLKEKFVMDEEAKVKETVPVAPDALNDNFWEEKPTDTPEHLLAGLANYIRFAARAEEYMTKVICSKGIMNALLEITKWVPVYQRIVRERDCLLERREELLEVNG
ncbi:hypothetical protein GE061_020315 [Apolygus lucorum]|uniref:Uncharacterized protein n=1 Tax=Apolygus lucorum TaxID=248454 RepID=A0A8S9WLX2_APOLU|nr:hypothetical protein GE061_020315 [Apolygus lucorum]